MNTISTVVTIGFVISSGVIIILLAGINNKNIDIQELEAENRELRLANMTHEMKARKFEQATTALNKQVNELNKVAEDLINRIQEIK
jgi:hypothetical protein